MRTFICAVFAAVLLSVPAFAQDNAGGSGVYQGNTFTITPPSSWQLVAGTLSEKELSQLPENIRNNFLQRNTDVIFINKPEKPDSGFMNSLNVVSINEEIILSDEAIKELEDLLKKQYDSMFNNAFEMETIEKQDFNGKDSMYVKGKYSIKNYNVTMEQYLVPSGKNSLVLTCTYLTDTGQSDAEACRAAVKTLSFK